MTALIRHITVDCADPYTLAGFWSEVTGYPRHPSDEPGADQALLVAPDGEGPGVLFSRVPEGKSGKNRVHLDLQPTDCKRDEQVDHLLTLGATMVSDQRNADGTGWVVLADPEGNEFCVERSLSERA
ncbi:MAG: VOC family protein [Hamadaea sp.]|uniref:VOC family protein n=1 Tax=Hamadaea sp. NPDC050747 TaxID=3155789 RepID=UPI00184B60C6|nr:VOC family protein [Hamadaea sp.]NUR48807.1 VOC family protein [Hamadaea sp.]NUR71320.1 VOC family protein [Hamadaea sp.]NUT03256.1 VOC family protein [Hamadaea sp.]